MYAVESNTSFRKLEKNINREKKTYREKDEESGKWEWERKKEERTASKEEVSEKRREETNTVTIFYFLKLGKESKE